MLTTLIKGPFSRPGWLFERKTTVNAVLSSAAACDLQLFSRNQNC